MTFIFSINSILIIFFISAKSLCASLGCEQDCKPSLEGGICVCAKGKKVAQDGRSCVDRNECEEWGFCDQKCENVDYANDDGNYRCSCVEGYELKNNMCRAKLSFPKMNILFTNTKSVFMMDPDRTNSQKEIFADLKSGSGLDFHYKKKLLFVTDVDKRKVYQMHFDEAEKTATKKRDYR